MNAEQAVFLREVLMGTQAFEMPVTRKVVAAVTESGSGYKPDAKSKTAKELAWHIVSAEAWFMESLLKGEFGMEGDGSMPAGISTIADIVSYYDRSVPPLVDQVKKLPADKLAAPLSFFGMFNNPGVTYLNFMNNHTIHHRGQLSAYLRALGSKVPSIYGGSADEPMQM